ncbi:unnamed protein product [Darwinula stevensoni]|uniref:Hexosyltransferase n=1 Tax=Darwinula stevensoni TaxID=69355 RepID=A0A7R9FSF6_9CRUS|nr:unnamed protein product [Darwinula stevensoni]CAG0902541.1 unnamed protein product [Darwinula stevensoni]
MRSGPHLMRRQSLGGGPQRKEPIVCMRPDLSGSRRSPDLPGSRRSPDLSEDTWKEPHPSPIQQRFLNRCVLHKLCVIFCLSFVYATVGLTVNSTRENPGERLQVEAEPRVLWSPRVQGEGCTVQGEGCEVQGEGCKVQGEGCTVLVLVHSAPGNAVQRRVVRETWGSVRSFVDRGRVVSVRVVFVVGNPVEGGVDGVEESLESERQRFHDIVRGDFQDTYRNLSVKSILGLKWATQVHPDALLVVKADDDVIVDVPSFWNHLRRSFSGDLVDLDGTLFCSVHLGAKPQRFGKWKVTESEYPGSEYPPYCAGLAYALTTNSARKLLERRTRTRGSVPSLWIDDVYVTGVLAEEAGFRHFRLNLRYALGLGEGARACERPPCPFLVVHVSQGDMVAASGVVKVVWQNMMASRIEESSRER